MTQKRIKHQIENYPILYTPKVTVYHNKLRIAITNEIVVNEFGWENIDGKYPF